MIQKVVQTDCIVGLKSLEEPIDVIITSPPYNVGIEYIGSDDRRIDYLSWMKEVFDTCFKVLSDKGHFFLQMGGIATRPTIPWEVLSQALSVGFLLQNEIVWVKSISITDNAEDSFGQFKPINSERLLNNTHEFIFHLTKTGKEPIDKLAVGVPLKYKSNLDRFSHKTDRRCRGNVWFIPYDTIQSKSERGGHPAVFPAALPEMCIKLSGVGTGSLVVDPFMGSGTTLVACKKLEMRGVGFDVATEYCRLAEQRLNH